MPLKFIKVPEDFQCSITCEIMTDPVITDDGESYERTAIAKWLESHDTSPNTNGKLDNKKLIPNRKLKSQISAFVESNRRLFEQELITAAQEGSFDIVQLVLNLGIGQVQDEQGWSALHHAAYRNHTAIVSLLLERQRPMDQATATLEVAANEALQRTAAQQLETLLQERDRLNHQLIGWHLRQELIDYDRLQMAYATLTKDAAKIIAQQCLEDKHRSIVTQLITREIMTCHAESSLDMDSLRAIILDQAKEALDEPATLAIREQLLGIEKQILQIRHETQYYLPYRVAQCTPLLLAIYSGHRDMVKILLDQDPDLTQVDGQQATLLHWAARGGQRDLLEFLLTHRVDGRARNKQGKMAVDLARAFHHEDCVELLEQSVAAQVLPLSARQRPLAAAAVDDAVGVGFFAKKKSPVAGQPKVGQAAVDQLLLHIALGEQDAAERILQSDATLLLYSGKVTDYSNRTFKRITGLKYALWALDWHMWKMLLKYLPQGAAKTQLQELETRGTEYGVHYDFNELLQALQTYIDQFASWNWEQRDKHWNEVIGGAQTRVPAHVANQYCHPYQDFHPTPSFTEDSLPRNFNLTINNNFYPLRIYSAGELGKNFAILRDVNLVASAKETSRRLHSPSPGAVRVWDDGVEGVAHDLAALTALCKMCTGQLADLKRQLEPVVASQRLGAY